MKTCVRNIRIVLAACVCAAAFPACSDMMETDSTSVIFKESNRLDSPNDSLYSVMGILSQAQYLGDRYVLLGELRGDLMEATTDADIDIQNISNFELSVDNEYAAFRDYYNVINNCNYAIQNMDTSIIFYEDYVMMPEFAQIKTIRAWVYWQLALATGEVSYIEEPVLTLEDALREYPVVGLEQLAALLIEDLTPYVGVRHLDYGTVDNYESYKMFIPIEMMLGDLYLFLNRYEEAAQMYYRLIDERSLTLSSSYSNNWSSVSRTSYSSSWWASYASTSSSEMLTSLVYSTEPDDYHPQLMRWSYNSSPSIVPSDVFVDAMARASHYYASTSSTQIQGYFVGDLRGEIELASGYTVPVSYGDYELGDFSGRLIFKFGWLSVSGGVEDPENEDVSGLNYLRSIPICRVPQLYLRLAEAINRYGRPATAFAVLKYGLNNTTLQDSTKVGRGERTGEAFLDFTNDKYVNNVGSATRGRGWGIYYDRTDYVIPDYTRYESLTVTDPETGEVRDTLVATTDNALLAEALADSIQFVEDCIVDEMAAETAFEGNRFFDLMRVARHRGQWPAYAAEKVSGRFGESADAMQAALLDENRWFMK